MLPSAVRCIWTCKFPLETQLLASKFKLMEDLNCSCGSRPHWPHYIRLSQSVYFCHILSYVSVASCAVTTYVHHLTPTTRHIPWVKPCSPLYKLASWSSLFIHPAVCLTTGPKPLPKPALHIVRSRASSFKWQYPVLSLRSFSSFLHLLPRLLVTSIPPFIFPSVTRCRRQLLCKMWSIQLAFHLLTSCPPT